MTVVVASPASSKLATICLAELEADIARVVCSAGEANMLWLSQESVLHMVCGRGAQHSLCYISCGENDWHINSSIHAT